MRTFDSYVGRGLKSIEGTLLGSYQADTPMVNGNFLTVDLAEDNVYIEKNAFGTFYGTWSVAREGFRCIDVLNARWGWDTASSIEKYDIPPGTDKIGVLLDELIDCECHYNPDSGNVVIIVTPHCQDFRLRVTGRNLYFFQYDKYGVANRKTKIKLLRQDKSGKGEVPSRSAKQK